jgi:ATP/maltotriose-dependent transcriptional regulator MalT
VAQIAAAAAPTSPRSAPVVASACAGAWLRGDLPAAHAFLEAAVVAARGADPVQARRVVQQASELAFLEGRLDTAASGFGEAAMHSIRAGDLFEGSWNVGSRALAFAYAGLLDQAEQEVQLGEQVAAQCGSPSARAFISFVHGEIAALADQPSAETHLRTAVALAESVDNRGIAGLARVTLATITGRRADPSTALSEYLAVIDTWQRTEAWTSRWVTLRNLVALLVRCGSHREAAVLYAATTQARSNAPPYGRDQALLDDVHRHLDLRFSAAERQALFEHGRSLNDDDVVDLALDAIRRAQLRQQGPASVVSLSSREFCVVSTFGQRSAVSGSMPSSTRPTVS